MFFISSKLLDPLLQPLTYIFGLLLLTLLLYRHARLGRLCLALALLLLLVFGTYPFPNFLAHLLENKYPPVSPPPDVDAVVVLSGMVNLQRSTPENLEFNDSVERILAGIHLVKQGTARRLIISGGSGDIYNQKQSEARLLQHFVLRFGIPPEQVLIDPDSRNTHENALHTREIMDAQGISSILLVTSAVHMPRSIGCFKKLGIHPIPYAVDYQSVPLSGYRPYHFLPNVGALEKTSAILHEYIGILMYTLTEYM